MTPQTSFETSNIFLLAYSPSDLHPAIFNSRSRSFSSQIRFVLLYTLPEIIDRALALRSRLSQCNCIRVLMVIELDSFDPKKSGLEDVEFLN